MIQVIPLFILFLSGVLSFIVPLKRSFRFFLFVICPFISFLLFVLQIFFSCNSLYIPWFEIGNLKFFLSMSFESSEVFICSVVSFILFCVQLAFINSSNKVYDNNKVASLLSMFSFFMCFSILSSNLFQFYIGVESMSVISAVLVGMGKKSVKNASITFLYNKFASVLFLAAVVLIAIELNNFNFYALKIGFENFSYNFRLFVASLLLLISCLCKGAQFPFTRWLVDASKADIQTSILLHSATLVSIGVIFISKCWFMFDTFPILKNIMVVIGSITAIWMAFCSLFQFDIKKLIAYTTSASIGSMFIALGIGAYSVAVLYFVCHAFFKSMFFMAFSYVIKAMQNEQNIFKMGGLGAFLPKILDILWIAFLSSVGVPFFVGFFAKTELLGFVFDQENNFVMTIVVVSNVLLITSLFRAVTLSMYGNTRADENTISRIQDASKKSLIPMWFLIAFSIIGSFIAWIMYGSEVLHFGFAGQIQVPDSVNYIKESIKEVIQMLIAGGLIVILHHYQKSDYKKLFDGPVSFLFRKNFILFFAYDFVKKTVLKILSYIYKISLFLELVLNKKIMIKLLRISRNIDCVHETNVNNQIHWFLLGILFCLLIIVFRIICYA